MSEIPQATLDALMARILLPACDYAAEKGVEINLEGMPLISWSRDSFAILQFIREQGLPNLGFVLDSGHAYANAEDLTSVVRTAGPLLHDTHLHDKFGPRGFNFARTVTQPEIDARDLHMIPGLGTINWIGVIRALWEIDFPGPIVFESPCIPGHPDSSVAQWARCVDLTIRMWRAFEEAAAYCPDP